MQQLSKILTFFLDGYQLGLDITSVKEINRNITYTPVPDAPPYIVGLLNLRGQVVTLFDLSQLMGYGCQHKIERNTCIVLKAGGDYPEYAGFLIDKTGSVIDVTPDSSEPPPANLVQPELVRIDRVVKLEEEGAVTVIELKLVVS